jgi:hypothetical protein
MLECVDESYRFRHRLQQASQESGEEGEEQA